MTVLFFITTIIASILAYSYKKKQKLQEFYANQDIRAESWALPSNNVDFFKPLADEKFVNSEKKPVDIQVMSYEIEQIDEEIENFYQSLEKLNPSEPVQITSNASEDCEPIFMSESQFRGRFDEAVSHLDYEPTLLNTADWDNNESYYMENIPASFAELADCQIADGRFGLQSWVVRIVGREKEYLHVADGTARTWINAENFLSKNLQYGDLLFIEVERSKEGLKVETLNILERSHDYPISHNESEEVKYYEYYPKQEESYVS